MSEMVRFLSDMDQKMSKKIHKQNCKVSHQISNAMFDGQQKNSHPFFDVTKFSTARLPMVQTKKSNGLILF